MGALILVTNDDGIASPGIWRLAEGLRTLGEVVVICPDRDYSGHGASIAHSGSISCVKAAGPFGAYALGAPPAACVWAGMTTLLPRRPDLVVSGVNIGPNLGLDVLVSGTVGAALFASSHGIPAVAVSTDLSGTPQWRAPVLAAVAAARELLAEPLPGSLVVNLNVPGGETIRGARICSPSRFTFLDQIDITLRHDGSTMQLVPSLQPCRAKLGAAGTDVAVYGAGLVAVTLLEPRPAHPWALKRIRAIRQAVEQGDQAMVVQTEQILHADAT